MIREWKSDSFVLQIPEQPNSTPESFFTPATLGTHNLCRPPYQRPSPFPNGVSTLNHSYDQKIVCIWLLGFSSATECRETDSRIPQPRRSMLEEVLQRIPAAQAHSGTSCRGVQRALRQNRQIYHHGKNDVISAKSNVKTFRIGSFVGVFGLGFR